MFLCGNLIDAATVDHKVYFVQQDLLAGNQMIESCTGLR